MITIYHNGKCSKSRHCLSIIQKSDLKFKVIEHLKDQIDMSHIKKIVYGIEGNIEKLVRTNEKEIKDQYIDFTDKDSIINLIFKHKICMQRPIVNIDEKIIICRPPEIVLKYIAGKR